MRRRCNCDRAIDAWTIGGPGASRYLKTVGLHTRQINQPFHVAINLDAVTPCFEVAIGASVTESHGPCRKGIILECLLVEREGLVDGSRPMPVILVLAKLK